MTASRKRTVIDTLVPQECEELARRVLGMVSGTQAQVHVVGVTSASVEFARGDAHLATETVDASVQLYVELGNRQARGSTNQFDERSLRTLVADVERLAREKRTQDDRWTDEDGPPILPPQQYPKGPQIFFPASVDAMTGEAQADIFRRAADAAEAEGLIAAGDAMILAGARSVLNTKGQWAYERRTFGNFTLTARTKDGTGSGWGQSCYEDWSRVNVQDVIQRAVSLARRSAKPSAVEPGRYTVILEPSAVAEMIHPIIGYPTLQWSARAADAGGTVFAKPVGMNKIGLQMMDRRLGLVSDPWDTELPGSMISLEWRPLVPVNWFEQGVLRHLAYDPRYAREKGTDPVYNPGGVRLTAKGPTQTLDEMIASTRRGVWVNRLSGVTVMNGGTLLLTGTTRDGTFLIENGKITKSIKNFRFTESPFFVFNQLEAWGEPIRASPAVAAPRLKLRDFNFTSLTDAV